MHNYYFYDLNVFVDVLLIEVLVRPVTETTLFSCMRFSHRFGAG
jgi:hypothetical protein